MTGGRRVRISRRTNSSTCGSRFGIGETCEDRRTAVRNFRPTPAAAGTSRTAVVVLAVAVLVLAVLVPPTRPAASPSPSPSPKGDPGPGPGASSGVWYRSCKGRPVTKSVGGVSFRSRPYPPSSSSSSSSGGGRRGHPPPPRPPPIPRPLPSFSSSAASSYSKGRRRPYYPPSSSSSSSSKYLKGFGTRNGHQYNDVGPQEVAFELSPVPPGRKLAKVCAKFRCCKFEGRVEEAKDCCYSFGNCCKQAFREHDDQCDAHRHDGRFPLPFASSSSGSGRHLGGGGGGGGRKLVI